MFKANYSFCIRMALLFKSQLYIHCCSGKVCGLHVKWTCNILQDLSFSELLLKEV